MTGPRGRDDVGEPEHLAPSELPESAVVAHQVFWDRLKRAGYEEL